MTIRKYLADILRTASNILGHVTCEERICQTAPPHSPFFLFFFFPLHPTAEALWRHDGESRGSRPAVVAVVLRVACKWNA